MYQAWPTHSGAQPCTTRLTWMFATIIQEKQLVVGEGWLVVGGHAAQRQSRG